MKKNVATKVVLSRDGSVKIGKMEIGTWEKDYVAGSFHFRPSSNEGRVFYKAFLNNGSKVDSFTQEGLREEIIERLAMN